MPAKLKQNTNCDKCRRAQEKLFLKGDKCFSPKCPLTRRNYPPGQHGSKAARARLTPYGVQLKEKQKAKRSYNLRERQFSNYVAKALKSKGNTVETLLKSLEMRLDNVVYRLGFAKSRDMARQLVNHGHFTVNGKKADIPSFQVLAAQTIGLRPKSLSSRVFENLSQTLSKKDLPAWLSVDAAALTGKVLGYPSLNEVQMNFDPKKIIEFYSR